MKNTKKVCMTFSICAAALILSFMNGCRGVDYVKFSNTIPGEYNLSGVSKIALIDFNTIPDDPVKGVYAADAATRQVMKDMIAAKFFKGKTYKIADLDVEKEVFAANGTNAKLAQRFDAILYGRVWWQTSKEYKNVYPVVYTLEKWRNEKYMSGRTDKGDPIYSIARLTESMTDAKVDHQYRASNATLMLSLTIYRLDKDGKAEKIVEDFAVADQNYLLNNGVFSTDFVMHGKTELSQAERIAALSENKDAKARKEANEKAGFVDRNQNAKTIPTALQTKIMLGKKLSDILGRKMTNTEVPVEAEFFGKYMFFAPIDETLLNAVISGNFAGARKALAARLQRAAGYEICDRIGSLSAYDKEPVKVAKDPACFLELKKAKTEEQVQKIEKEIAELVKDTIDDFENELYALAVCEEACGEYEAALENYRVLLKHSAKACYAQGISRCLISLDMTNRVKDVAKAAKKAGKKASVR